MAPNLRFDVARLVAVETLFAIPLITVMEDAFKGFVSYALFLMKPVCIQRGESVCRCGSPGTETFFLVEGECDLLNSLTGVGRLIGENAVFEQYALMAQPDELYRTVSTATAITTKCILYSLTIHDFKTLEDVSPAVSTYFVSQLASVLVADDMVALLPHQVSNVQLALRRGQHFRAVAEHNHAKVKLRDLGKVAMANLYKRRSSEWSPDLLPKQLQMLAEKEQASGAASASAAVHAIANRDAAPSAPPLEPSVIDRATRAKVGEARLSLELQSRNAELSPREKLVALRRDNALCEIAPVDGRGDVLGYLAVSFDVQWAEDEDVASDGGEHEASRIQRLLEKGKALQQSMERAVTASSGRGLGVEEAGYGQRAEEENGMTGAVLSEPEPVGNSADVLSMRLLNSGEGRKGIAAQVHDGVDSGMLDKFDTLTLTVESLELTRDFVHHQLRQLRDSASISSRFSPIQVRVSHDHVAALLYENATKEDFPEVSICSVTTSLRRRQWQLNCSSAMPLSPPPFRPGVGGSNNVDVAISGKHNGLRRFHVIVRCENESDVRRNEKRGPNKLLHRPLRCFRLVGSLDATTLFDTEQYHRSLKRTIPLFFEGEDNESDTRNNKEGDRRGDQTGSLPRNKKTSPVGYVKVKLELCDFKPSNTNSESASMIEANDDESDLILSSIHSSAGEESPSRKRNLVDGGIITTITSEELHPRIQEIVSGSVSASRYAGSEAFQFGVMLDSISRIKYPEPRNVSSCCDQPKFSVCKGRENDITALQKTASISIHYVVPSVFTCASQSSMKFERTVKRKVESSRWSSNTLSADFSGNIHIFHSAFAADAGVTEAVDLADYSKRTLPMLSVDGKFAIENPFTGHTTGRSRQDATCPRIEHNSSNAVTDTSIMILSTEDSRSESESIAPTLGTVTPIVTIHEKCSKVDIDEQQLKMLFSDGGIVPDTSDMFKMKMVLRKIRFDVRECCKFAMPQLPGRSQQQEQRSWKTSPLLGCELQGQLILTNAPEMTSESKIMGVPFALWWDAVDRNLNSSFAHAFQVTRSRFEASYDDAPVVGHQSQALFALHVENGFFGTQSRETIVGEARLNLYEVFTRCAAKCNFPERKGPLAAAETLAISVDVPIDWDSEGGDLQRLPTLLPLRISFHITHRLPIEGQIPNSDGAISSKLSNSVTSAEQRGDSSSSTHPTIPDTVMINVASDDVTRSNEFPTNFDDRVHHQESGMRNEDGLTPHSWLDNDVQSILQKIETQPERLDSVNMLEMHSSLSDTEFTVEECDSVQMLDYGKNFISPSGTSALPNSAKTTATSAIERPAVPANLNVGIIISDYGGLDTVLNKPVDTSNTALGLRLDNKEVGTNKIESSSSDSVDDSLELNTEFFEPATLASFGIEEIEFSPIGYGEDVRSDDAVALKSVASPDAPNDLEPGEVSGDASAEDLDQQDAEELNSVSGVIVLSPLTPEDIPRNEAIKFSPTEDGKDLRGSDAVAHIAVAPTDTPNDLEPGEVSGDVSAQDLDQHDVEELISVCEISALSPLPFEDSPANSICSESVQSCDDETKVLSNTGQAPSDVVIDERAASDRAFDIFASSNDEGSEIVHTTPLDAFTTALEVRRDNEEVDSNKIESSSGDSVDDSLELNTEFFEPATLASFGIEEIEFSPIGDGEDVRSDDAVARIAVAPPDAPNDLELGEVSGDVPVDDLDQHDAEELKSVSEISALSPLPPEDIRTSSFRDVQFADKAVQVEPDELQALGSVISESSSNVSLLDASDATCRGDTAEVNHGTHHGHCKKSTVDVGCDTMQIPIDPNSDKVNYQCLGEEGSKASSILAQETEENHVDMELDESHSINTVKPEIHQEIVLPSYNVSLGSTVQSNVQCVVESTAPEDPALSTLRNEKLELVYEMLREIRDSYFANQSTPGQTVKCNSDIVEDIKSLPKKEGLFPQESKPADGKRCCCLCSGGSSLPITETMAHRESTEKRTSLTIADKEVKSLPETEGFHSQGGKLSDSKRRRCPSPPASSGQSLPIAEILTPNAIEARNASSFIAHEEGKAVLDKTSSMLHQSKVQHVKRCNCPSPAVSRGPSSPAALKLTSYESVARNMSFSIAQQEIAPSTKTISLPLEPTSQGITPPNALRSSRGVSQYQDAASFRPFASLNRSTSKLQQVTRSDQSYSLPSLFAHDSETERIARIMQGSMTYWMKDDSSSSCDDDYCEEEETDEDCYF
ncbi:unnamed protein product [Phytophthora fragariaefolia]|uniref:Unnamed protein product n=1 Tax=Phytophthora fragariaefolia TaxID=1490495 RepID=A0A9W6XLK5_9STRA|nr:unnamed protein product [Phytophthora fragariaefolia]